MTATHLETNQIRGRFQKTAIDLSLLSNFLRELYITCYQNTQRKAVTDSNGFL